jgi:hypothetical protein
MKADSASVVALTEAGKLPRALTTVLRLADAIAKLKELQAAQDWPHKATHPKIELRDTSGNTLDPKTGEISEKPKAPKKMKAADPAPASDPK